MQVTFSCTIDDYITFIKWHRFPQGKNSSYWVLRICSAAGLMGWPLLAALFFKGNPEYPTLWKLFAILAGFLFVHCFILGTVEGALTAWVRKSYNGRDGYGHFGKKTIRLLEKHMYVQSEATESSIDYWALTKVAETPTHVFILQGPNGHVIPKASILEGALDPFLEQLKKNIATAEAARPPEAAVIAPAPHGDDWLGISAFVVGAVLLAAAGFLLNNLGIAKAVTCQCSWLIWVGIFLGLPLLGFSIYRFFFKRKRAGVAPGP